MTSHQDTVMDEENGENGASGAKRGARDRLAEERRRDAARGRRRRKLGIAGAAVLVLAVAATAGVVVQNSRAGSGSYVSPAGTTGTGNQVVPVGQSTAKATLTVYEDPRCPACGEFEKEFHPTINQLEQTGKVKIQYHVVSFIDRHDGGTGSKNAANALACAQNVGRFHDYHDVLYANQPDETVDAWADKSKLTALAQRVPGLSSPAFNACVDNGTYRGWVSAVEDGFDKSGYQSTPTVLLNGTPAYPTYNGQQISPANLVKWVEQA